VDRIFVGLSWELHCRIVRSSDGGQWGDKRAHNSTIKWVSAHYTFVSLHDSDHESVVRILVALSCELWSFIHIILDYITRHNFSPTRSVTSGNRTPGSRFYSDLLDTSVCIRQFVLKRLSKRQATRMIVGGSLTVQFSSVHFDLITQECCISIT